MQHFDQAERAKQFMPFAALKGYEEALRAKERIVVEKIELTDESKEELSRVLNLIKKNDTVTATYFENGEYIELTGIVSRIDIDARILKIVNTKISFEDIYKLNINK